MDVVAEDLDMFNVYQVCVDVDIMIAQYAKFVSDLLDKHAPNKNIYVADILAMKAFRCQNELIWRKTRITIKFGIYYDYCRAVGGGGYKQKQNRVNDCEETRKRNFSHKLPT